MASQLETFKVPEGKTLKVSYFYRLLRAPGSTLGTSLMLPTFKKKKKADYLYKLM